MRGLQSNELNKFYSTEARMLDSIYHMTLKLFKTHIFGVKNVKILPYFIHRYNGRHNATLLNL